LSITIPAILVAVLASECFAFMSTSVLMLKENSA